MPLSTIPVLPENWDLFDWSDWQASKNALVQGGKTKLFAKEAWNAIVDTLNVAITAAGLEWDPAFTTAEDARITMAYGKLSAKMFNSVRYNLDNLAYLGWLWAYKEDYRGYIGRVDFNGRETHGRECDLVYPEYIFDLVARLNLVVEIMRGTAEIQCTEVPFPIGAAFYADILSRRAAIIDCPANFKVVIDSGARAGLATLLEHADNFHVVFHADILSREAARGYVFQNLMSARLADGNSKIGTLGSAMFSPVSKTSAGALAFHGVTSSTGIRRESKSFSSGFSNPCVIGKSNVRRLAVEFAFGHSLPAILMSSNLLSIANKLAQGVSLPGLFGTGFFTATTFLEAEGKSHPGLPVIAGVIPYSKATGMGASNPYVPAAGKLIAPLESSATALSVRGTAGRSACTFPAKLAANTVAAEALTAVSGATVASDVFGRSFSLPAKTVTVNDICRDVFKTAATLGIPRAAVALPISNSERFAEVLSCISSRVYVEQISKSFINSAAVPAPGLSCAAAYRGRSKQYFSGLAPHGNLLCAQSISDSVVWSNPVCNAALTTGAGPKTKSCAIVNPKSQAAFDIDGYSNGKCNSKITWICNDGLRGSCTIKENSNSYIEFAGATAALCEQGNNIRSDRYAALDTAWYPPVRQTDGSLWIRQSHAVQRVDDGLEVS